VERGGHQGRRSLSPWASVALSAVLALAAVGFSLAQEPTPFFDARKHQPEYVGPGREEPESEDVTEVRLAYFGPPDAGHAEWGEGWRGASMAIEKANQSGGWRGKPFVLMPAWSENPWGTGVSALAKLVYEGGVWAVVGGVDGVATHLAEQIIVKAGVPQVSFGNTDPGVHLTNVPWTFSLPPSDDVTGGVVARAVVDRAGSAGRWAAVSATDHDSRVTWKEIDLALNRQRSMAPALHLEIDPGAANRGEVARAILGSGAPVALVVAGARDAGRMVRTLREGGFRGSIVGGVACGRTPFLEEARAAAEGVVLPLAFDARQAPREFVATYQARFGAAPDWLAADAYDAVWMVVAAVRRAGLNRARILDALRAVTPWEGVSGRIEWNATGRARRSVPLGIIHDGRVMPLP